MKRSLSIFTSLVFITSCSKVYDQKIAKSQPLFNETVNEKPYQRSFLENNNKHKVILAVVDTGVDYNHPILMDNIHFDLNDEGNPIAAGYDFVGDDAWASPYLANTVIIDKNLDLDNDNDNKNISDDASKLISEKLGVLNQLFEVGKKSKILARYINPLRGYVEEIQNAAGHGTHVAGLASYDDSAIGILPVRVLPGTVSVKANAQNIKDIVEDTEDEVLENIYKGIEFAINKGAKVINLSLGAMKEIEGNEKPKVDYEKLKVLSLRLETLLKSHPNIVVVAATGNDSKWMDQDSIYNFPCGVNAPNVLCVGALKSDGKLSSFTNIVLKQNINIVYASGVDLFSTYPQKMCSLKAKDAFSDIESDTFGASFMSDCVSVIAPKIEKMSGTSMASPIVSRMVAQAIMANPEMSGKEIIDLLLSRADTADSTGLRMVFHKLKASPPSWYEDKFMVPGKMGLYSLAPTLLSSVLKRDNWVNILVPMKNVKDVKK